MTQLTFLDKIQILFNLLISSPIIIGIFAFTIILMVILFVNTKFNKKIIKIILSIIYVGLIVFAIIKYNSYFMIGIDSFITIFMANIYFPIIPVYIGVMIASFIIMIVSVTKKKNKKLMKIINILFFSMIQFCFVLFIYLVEKNNIDLSSNENLYTNSQTLTLLELGMGLFVVWVLILLVSLYLKKADKIFKKKKIDVEQEKMDEYINDYNEPDIKKDNVIVDVASNNFNKDVVQVLVPEMSMFENNGDEEILEFKDDDDFVTSGAPVNIFEGFELEPVRERKNNNAEIVNIDD